MKMVLILQCFIEVAQERIIKVDDGPASAANEVMMGCSFYSFVVWLFT